jgi:hypothetical protein
MGLHIYSRNLVGLGLLIIICSRLYSFVRTPNDILCTSIPPNQESTKRGNLWLGLGSLHNLAWEEGSPYEFSNTKAWGIGLGLENKWGPFWLKLSGSGIGNLGSDRHTDTLNGQSEELLRSYGLMHVGVDICYFFSAAEGRFKIGPSVGGRLIYEEALVYPPSHESIVWDISEVYLEPALGIQTNYDINENWMIVASLMHYNTKPSFDRARIIILFRELLRGSFPPAFFGRGCGIELWFKNGRYKSVIVFFTVAAL